MDENYYRRRFLIQFLNTDFIVKKSKQKYFEEVVQNYMNTGECLELQDFIGEFIKNEHTWITNIGLIDAMDAIIKSVKEEGYLNI